MAAKIQDSSFSDSSTLLAKIFGELSGNRVNGRLGSNHLSFYDDLYANNGVIQNIISTLPSDATRHDMNVNIDGVEDKSLLDYLDSVMVISRGIDEINYKDAIYQALIFARLYGDGFIIVGYNDTKDLSKPLSKRGSLNLNWITVRTRDELAIDINKRCYVLNLTQANETKELKSRLEIHPSRVIRFKGVELYERALVHNQYFNRSLIDLIYKEFCRFDGTLAAVAKMLKSHSAFSYGINGLSGIVQQGKEELVRNKFKLMLDSLSNIGGLTYDKDNESVEYLNRSYSGVNELVDQLKNALLSVSGLPAYKLFNVASSSAMSTSAESEQKDWVLRVSTYQQNKIDEPVCKLIKPLFPAGTRVSIGFQPYYTLNEAEESKGQANNVDAKTPNPENSEVPESEG